MQGATVMRLTKQSILQKYGTPPAHLLRKGMEAEVYALGAGRLLKLYSGTTSLGYLTTLQGFYAAINPFPLSYSLPYIEMVRAEGDICISTERRLPGSPMSEILFTLTKTQMDRMMQDYLAAALELARIQVPPDFDRFKLLDAEGISRRIDGDWHQFLWRFLARKLKQVTPYLKRDVTDFAVKMP